MSTRFWPGTGAGQFTTTHWSVVLAAAREPSPEAAQALAQLCQAYWYPLYAYVRRKGYDLADAQDLTQEFFARLLERTTSARPTAARGSSARSCSLRSSTSWPRNGSALIGSSAAAARRSSPGRLQPGGAVSLEPADDWTAERIYERRWRSRCWSKPWLSSKPNTRPPASSACSRNCARLSRARRTKSSTTASPRACK